MENKNTYPKDRYTAFINEKHPWEYDIKREKYKDNISEDLKLFVIYRSSEDGFDADGSIVGTTNNEKYFCGLTRQIYRELWSFDDIESKMKDRPFTGYYNKIKRYGTITKNNQKYLMGPDTINTIKKVLFFGCNQYDEYKKEIQKLNLSIDKVNMVCKYVSTVGNFILVPRYLNPARVSVLGTDDYFDKTLEKMKNKSSSEKWKYNKKEIEWVAEDFCWYINAFYLWDYVVYNEKRKTFDVKSLYMEPKRFKENYICNLKAEGKEKHKDNFVSNIIWCIKRRGFYMTLLLKLKEKNIDKFIKIQNEILECKFNDMNDATKFLIDVINDDNYIEYYKNNICI